MDHILTQIEGHLKANQLEEASMLIDEYETAVNNNARFWNLKGVLMYNLNELHASINCFSMSMELDPDYPDARINMELISKIQSEGDLSKVNLTDHEFLQSKVDVLDKAIVRVETCIPPLECGSAGTIQNNLTDLYMDLRWSDQERERLLGLVSSRFLSNMYDNVFLCIEEVLQTRDREQMNVLVEFTLLSLLKEIREEIYFFGMIHPYPDKWDHYYSHEFAEANLNRYAKRSLETGTYKYPVSIVVPAFNKLDYTKKCVEAILKYTGGIEYELILVNDGSSDGTREYYASVQHPNKKVINLYKNTGAMNAYFMGVRAVEGRVLASVSNDVIVSNNWLNNLLVCVDSDPTIGMVVPLTNNISNDQSIQVTYQSYDEMQQFAAQFNQSNQNLWIERERLCPFLHVVPMSIYGKGLCHDRLYQHGEFCDDDISLLLRKNGYKLMLAGDTFCHHYGSISLGQAQRENNSLQISRLIFKQKNGLDPWNDRIQDVSYLFPDLMPAREDSVQVLSVDPGFGMIPYAMRNRYKQAGITNVNFVNAVLIDHSFSSISSQIFGRFVESDSIHDLVKKLNGNKFDHIILCQPLESYEDIKQMIRSLKMLLSQEGEIRFLVSNPYSQQVISKLISVNVQLFDEQIERKFISFTAIEKLLQDEGFGNVSLNAIPSQKCKEEAVGELKNMAARMGVKLNTVHDLLYTAENILFAVRI